MDVGTNMYLQYLQGNVNALQQLVEMYSDGLVRFAGGNSCPQPRIDSLNPQSLAEDE